MRGKNAVGENEGKMKNDPHQLSLAACEQITPGKKTNNNQLRLFNMTKFNATESKKFTHVLGGFLIPPPSTSS